MIMQCRQLFYRTLWPIPKTFKDSKNLVKLCQNQKGSEPVFATLFDTESKIAIYSATQTVAEQQLQFIKSLR